MSTIIDPYVWYQQDREGVVAARRSLHIRFRRAETSNLERRMETPCQPST